MSNIAIVTDSTAYLLPETIEAHQIKVIPLKVHWGEETFLDGVDISPTEFYNRLEQDPVIPTTSQPSMHDFLQVFEEVANHSDGIVAPLISSGVSGTVDSALAAKAEFKEIPVEIIDTHSTSAAQALVVLAAARAAADGFNLADVSALATGVARRMHIYFVVDTLKYLHKGGRIGGASRYLGSALSIKPILYFDEHGKIEAQERVRTKNNALKRLITLVEEKSDGKPIQVGVIHANAPEVASAFRDQITERFNCEEIHTLELSPAIGTHTGPGTIGVAFYV